MTQLIDGKFVPIDMTKNAMGGTELMAKGLASHVDTKGFQIVCSRVSGLREDLYRIFWAHDLPGDPASDFLKGGGWRQFHKLVFVSNWQMWGYCQLYGIPFNVCEVIPNAITPIKKHKKPDPAEVINLIYFSTPHRGLDLLVPAFDELHQTWSDQIHLDVYSSFGLYGWAERDEQFQGLFDKCSEHPGITYHGSKDNKTIRSALEKAHILAYPSTWQETSCLVLIESMSAGLTCVHSNLGALPETSAGLTNMYPFQPDAAGHLERFKDELDNAICSYTQADDLLPKVANAKHSWDTVKLKWMGLLDTIRIQKPSKSLGYDMFTIRID